MTMTLNFRRTTVSVGMSLTGPVSFPPSTPSSSSSAFWVILWSSGSLPAGRDSAAWPTCVSSTWLWLTFSWCVPFPSSPTKPATSGCSGTSCAKSSWAFIRSLFTAGSSSSVWWASTATWLWCTLFTLWEHGQDPSEWSQLLLHGWLGFWLLSLTWSFSVSRAAKAIKLSATLHSPKVHRGVVVEPALTSGGCSAFSKWTFWVCSSRLSSWASATPRSCGDCCTASHPRNRPSV